MFDCEYRTREQFPFEWVSDKYFFFCEDVQQVITRLRNVVDVSQNKFVL